MAGKQSFVRAHLEVRDITIAGVLLLAKCLGVPRWQKKEDKKGMGDVLAALHRANTGFGAAEADVQGCQVPRGM